MRLWDRIHHGMEAGFEAALAAAQSLAEKAGESIELTRLRRERSRCETEVASLLAKLGNAVYEKTSQDRLSDLVGQLGVKDTIVEIARKEACMVDIDSKLQRELAARGGSKAAARDSQKPLPLES